MSITFAPSIQRVGIRLNDRSSELLIVEIGLISHKSTSFTDFQDIKLFCSNQKTLILIYHDRKRLFDFKKQKVEPK